MSHTSSNRNQSQLEDLVDDLESAFKSFVALYTPESIENRTNHELHKKTALLQAEGNRVNMETQLTNLLDKARTLETQLVKSKLEVVRTQPKLVAEEEMQCLRAELERKTKLLKQTKEKLFNCEHVLRTFGNSIDASFKNRLDSCAQILNSYDQQQQQAYQYQSQFNPSSVRSDYAGANQSFEQQPGSHENSIIVLDSNKPYN